MFPGSSRQQGVNEGDERPAGQPQGGWWGPPTDEPASGDWAPPSGPDQPTMPPPAPGGGVPPDLPPPAAEDTPQGPFANPWLAAGAAFAASAAVTLVLWEVLALPANLLTDIFGDDGKTCGGKHRPGTSGMYWCSARVALWRLVGPIVIAVAALFARRPLRRLVDRVRPSVPSTGRFLITPMLATGLFTMVFASIHSDTAGGSGYLPQRLFPAVVGLLTHLMPLGSRMLTRKTPGFFAARDRVPTVLRLVIALGVPFALSYFATRNVTQDISGSEQLEQRTIVMSIGFVWLALVPRGGRGLGGTVGRLGRIGRIGGLGRLGRLGLGGLFRR